MSHLGRRTYGKLCLNMVLLFIEILRRGNRSPWDWTNSIPLLAKRFGHNLTVKVVLLFFLRLFHLPIEQVKLLILIESFDRMKQFRLLVIICLTYESNVYYSSELTFNSYPHLLDYFLSLKKLWGSSKCTLLLISHSYHSTVYFVKRSDFFLETTHCLWLTT